ncbi:hypothetical protein ABT329_29615, partial [Streptomyces minutiscleroticus]
TARGTTFSGSAVSPAATPTSSRAAYAKMWREVLEMLAGPLPGIGKVRAAQLLDELEISESRRVQGLGARQKERLL